MVYSQERGLDCHQVHTSQVLRLEHIGSVAARHALVALSRSTHLFQEHQSKAECLILACGGQEITNRELIPLGVDNVLWEHSDLGYLRLK